MRVRAASRGGAPVDVFLCGQRVTLFCVSLRTLRRRCRASTRPRRRPLARPIIIFDREVPLAASRVFRKGEPAAPTAARARVKGLQPALVLSGGMAVEARSAYVVLLTLYC